MSENKIGDALEDVKTDIGDASQEAQADIADSVSDAVSDTAEMAGNAEDVVSETVEAGESVVMTEEEAGENVSESGYEVKETIEEEVRAAYDPDYDPTRLKGTAPNSVPVEVKKGRKPLSRTNVIVIVVCAVIVVACLIFVGFKVGWFDFLKTKIKLADTSRVEVYKEDVEVTDDTIDYYVDSVLSSMATTETVEDGTVESGDTVNIDYVGTYKDTGKAFEGGSAEGYDLTIGSGSFIDGFEDGLIGKKSGETVNLNLTFPEDYQSEELAGQDVVFEVKINSIKRTVTPELTDEWVKEYSAKYCPETYNTVDEFRTYAKDTVTDYYLNNAIYQYLSDNSEVLEYDEETEKMLVDYSNDSLSYYASMYGMDADSYASMSGYNTAEEYNKATAHQYMDMAMIVDEICKKNNITYTDEELDKAIEQYMKDQKYIDQYTVEEFKKQSGETWLWLFTNLEFKFDKAMDSLKDNVIVLEEKPTEEESDAEGAVEEALDEEAEIELDEDSADGEIEIETDAEGSGDNAESEPEQTEATTAAN